MGLAFRGSTTVAAIEADHLSTTRARVASVQRSPSAPVQPISPPAPWAGSLEHVDLGEIPYDEAAEAMLYRLLQDRLKGATIISIGHRSTLRAFHGRRVELVTEDAIHQLRDVPMASAAE